MALISSRTRKKTYCPYKHKWQLADWAIEYKGFKRTTAYKMSKRQLYAIYYKS